MKSTVGGYYLLGLCILLRKKRSIFRGMKIGVFLSYLNLFLFFILFYLYPCAFLGVKSSNDVTGHIDQAATSSKFGYRPPPCSTLQGQVRDISPRRPAV